MRISAGDLMSKNPYLEQNLTENNVDEAWHSGSGIHPMNYKSAYSRGKEWDEGPDHPAAKHFFASQKKAKSTSSDEPHSVHIGGKKWKTFSSHSHASNVAKKIKGATVVKESTNPYEQLDELKDTTLMSYAQKVSDDSMKHEKDPTKRSAAKRNKSVMGFSRALNKLEARPQKEEVELIGESDSQQHLLDKAKEAKKNKDMVSHHEYMSDYYQAHADARTSGGAGNHIRNVDKAREHAHKAQMASLKENLDEAKSLSKMSADELDKAHKENEAKIKEYTSNPTKSLTRGHPLMNKRRSINLYKLIRAKQTNEEIERVDEAKVCKVCKKNPCVCDSNTMKEEKDYSKPIAKLKDMLGSLKRDVSTVVKGHARLEKKEKAEHEKSKMDGVKAKAQEKVDGAKAKAQEKIDKMNTDPTPEDHQAALNHFASQYRQARMTKNTDAANEHARNYHEYSKKLTGVYLKKLKAIK